MRSFVLKLALLGVSATAVAGIAATVASAVEETGATCAASGGVATLSPGIEETAKVQNITIKGTAGECAGSAGSSTKFVLHVKTAAPLTCAEFNGEGVLAEGTGILKWGHGHGNSQGAFSLAGSASSFSLSGSLEQGPYAGMSLSDTLSGTPVFKGKGEPCTKKNKLKRIELTGTTALVIA
jgi:hypothetical protein